MTQREAAIELKRRGWTRKRGSYVPPAKMRGVPRHGLCFNEACSFEAISYRSNKSRH